MRHDEDLSILYWEKSDGMRNEWEMEKDALNSVWRGDNHWMWDEIF